MVIEKSRWAKSYLLFGFFVIGMLYISSETIRKYATEDYYKSRGYANPEIIFSDNSFYHSVEVIKTYKDSYGVVENSKASFINGVRYFDYYFDEDINDETSLSEFTYFLAELPAKYLYYKLDRKLRVLILGGGSMYSINRVSSYSSKTTLVEIDPVVIESAKECWSEFNNYNNISNYEIVIDDAKHFLRTTDEKYDLIIMDISAPYYLGTALLHNKDFFEIVRGKLKAGGIFSESTQNRPSSNRPNAMGMKILASVASVFPKYSLVDCDSSPRGKRGFVYSSDTMNVDHKILRRFMSNDNKLDGTHLYSESNKKYDLSKTNPYSLTNMEILFYGNLNRIKSRLRIDERIKRGGRFFEKRKTQTSDLKLKLPEMIFRQLNVPVNYILFFVVIILGLIIRFMPDSKSK
jgi:spermidine synthase